MLAAGQRMADRLRTTECSQRWLIYTHSATSCCGSICGSDEHLAPVPRRLLQPLRGPTSGSDEHLAPVPHRLLLQPLRGSISGSDEHLAPVPHRLLLQPSARIGSVVNGQFVLRYGAVSCCDQRLRKRPSCVCASPSPGTAPSRGVALTLL